MARRYKQKKKCCKSNPRCKRCPVVAKRLEQMGVAERRSGRIVVLSIDVTGKQLKLARKR